MWLYNGVLLPKLPNMENKDEYTTAYGYHIIFMIGDIYYAVCTGMLGGYQFYVDKTVSPAMLWLRYTGSSYELANGSWVKLEANFPSYVHITEADKVVWTNYQVGTGYPGMTLSSNGTIVLAGTQPQQPISDITIHCPSSITLERSAKNINITADLTYLATCDTSITYTITGVTSSGTTFKQIDITSGSYVKHNNFVLTVAPDEAVQNITITFTSVAKSSVTASKTIRILQAPNAKHDAKSFMLGRIIGRKIADRKNLSLDLFNPETDISLTDGVLYIKNAKVIQNGSILEVK